MLSAKMKIANKIMRRIKHRIYRMRYLENEFKRKSNALANMAISKGTIKRERCVLCGRKAVGHHHDYSLPYSLIWLCVKHHWEEHKRIRRYRCCPAPSFYAANKPRLIKRHLLINPKLLSVLRRKR